MRPVPCLQRSGAMQPQPVERRRVLLVDDNAWLRPVLAELLAGEGYEVCEADSGSQALQQIREQCPDVVVLDVVLPWGSGLAVLDVLRADERTRRLPIILMRLVSVGSPHAGIYDSGALASSWGHRAPTIAGQSRWSAHAVGWPAQQIASASRFQVHANTGHGGSATTTRYKPRWMLCISAWLRAKIDADETDLKPHIADSRSFRKPWSRSIPLVRYRPVQCSTPGTTRMSEWQPGLGSTIHRYRRSDRIRWRDRDSANGHGCARRCRPHAGRHQPAGGTFVPTQRTAAGSATPGSWCSDRPGRHVRPAIR
jgi:hypothetical protein